MSSKLTLVSSDYEVFTVDVEVAKMSQVLKTMLETLEDDGEDEMEEGVNVAVRGDILELIIRWAKHHKENPTPEDADVITPWVKDFLNMEQPILFELMNAANYLHVQSLLDATCKTVASWLTGKSPAEMRALMEGWLPARRH